MGIIVNETEMFQEWLSKLEKKDNPKYSKITSRLLRLRKYGHFGDKKQLDDNLFELRGLGRHVFRIYYVHESENTILALTGGDKSTQKEDILKAKELIRELTEDTDED